MIHFTIFLICLALFAAGALTTYLIWSGYHKREMRDLTTRLRDEHQAALARRDEMQGDIQRDFYRMKAEDVDPIALFLRDNYKSEIDAGSHGGRTLGQIVTGYLARERRQTKLLEDASQQRAAEAVAATNRINAGL